MKYAPFALEQIDRSHPFIVYPDHNDLAIVIPL